MIIEEPKKIASNMRELKIDSIDGNDEDSFYSAYLLYSYDTPVAMIVKNKYPKNKKDEYITFMTTYYYSPTTTRHINKFFNGLNSWKYQNETEHQYRQPKWFEAIAEGYGWIC